MGAKDQLNRQLIKDDTGQAVFEFIVFLPFLIFLFTVMSTVGNSINGSINQQKAVRNYFYYLVKGNSYLPARDDIEVLAKNNNYAGFLAIGWRDRSSDNENAGASAYSPCYKFNIFPGSEQKREETCDDPIAEGKTNLVRVYTYYGVCSENYDLIDGKALINYQNRGVNSCSVQKL